MIELEIDKCVHYNTFRCLRATQLKVIFLQYYVNEDS
jgi:hypothetical protein